VGAGASGPPLVLGGVAPPLFFPSVGRRWIIYLIYFGSLPILQDLSLVETASPTASSRYDYLYLRPIWRLTSSEPSRQDAYTHNTTRT